MQEIAHYSIKYVSMKFTSCVGNLCVAITESLLDLFGLSKVLLLELCVEELWSDKVSDLALGT